MLRRSMTVRMMTVIAASALMIAAGCEYPPPAELVVEPPEDPVAEMREDAMLDELMDEEESKMDWTISSSAFDDGDTIPVKYTADGENISPPLSFEGVPEGAVEIALICHDPDAPREGGWTHWVVYGMPPDIDGLPEDVPAEPTLDDPQLVQGENSWEAFGYGGPSPPAGDPHRYQFRGYALSETLDLDPGATKQEVEAAMNGKILGEAMLEGLYGR